MTDRWGTALRALVCVAVVGAAVANWPDLPERFSVVKATIVWVCALLALAVVAARVVATGRLAVPWSPVAVAALAFAAWVAVATPFSVAPAVSVVGATLSRAGLASYAAGAVLLCAVLVAFDERSLVRLVQAFVVAAVVVSAWGVWQVLGNDPIEIPGSSLTVGSTIGNPNFVAGWLAVAAPLLVWSMRTDRVGDTWALLAGGAGLASLVVIVACRSAQGPAALVPGVAVALLPSLRMPNRRFVVGGVLALGVVAVLAAPRIVSEVDQSFVERRHFWPTAVRLGVEHPLVGVGPDAFGEVWYRERPEEHARRYPARNAGAAHSVPLQHLATAGIPALVAWLSLAALVGRALWRGLRQGAGDRALLAALGGAWVAYQVQSLVSIEVPALAVAQFVLAGAVVVAAGARARREVAVPRAVGVPVAIAALVAIVPATRPLRAEVALERGLDALVDGDVDAAVDAYDDAERLAPWDARYPRFRSAQLPGVEPRERTAAAVARYAELDAGSGYAAVDAARYFEDEGDQEAADRWWDEAVERDPHNPEVRRPAG